MLSLRRRVHVYMKVIHSVQLLLPLLIALSLSEKFINNVLPSHTDVSISKKDALVKFKLSEEEITYVHVNFKPLLNST